VDSNQKHDPMWLYENRPNKFERWVKKTCGEPAEETKPKKASKAMSNNQDIPPPTLMKAQSTPVPKKTVDVGFDLIDFNAPADKGLDFGAF